MNYIIYAILEKGGPKELLPFIEKENDVGNALSIAFEFSYDNKEVLIALINKTNSLPRLKEAYYVSRYMGYKDKEVLDILKKKMN